MKVDIDIDRCKYSLRDVVNMVSVFLIIFVLLNVIAGPTVANILAIIMAIGGFIAKRGWGFVYNANRR